MRERFEFATQLLVDEDKEEVLVQCFLAMFERNRSWNRWPDEAKLETVGNMRQYFGYCEYPDKVLREALLLYQHRMTFDKVNYPK